MRALIKLMAIVALIWPLPIAAPAMALPVTATADQMIHHSMAHGVAAPAMALPVTATADQMIHHSMAHGQVTVDLSRHSPAASHLPGKHGGPHIPDCCVGSACFGLGLLSAIDWRPEFVGGPAPPTDAARLAARSLKPALPPPRS